MIEHRRHTLVVTALLVICSTSNFGAIGFTCPGWTHRRHHSSLCNSQHEDGIQTTTEEFSRTTTTTGSTEKNVGIQIDPKVAVKIFGRLAEKYIALDSSGGMCCYSACTNCEYRLPGGGYIMADQSSARPKWIPSYEQRTTSNRQHVTKWSREIFDVGTPSVSRDEFVQRIQDMEYVPPLGGPYVSASSTAAAITEMDVAALQYLFDTLAEGKSKLTKYKMSVRLKQLSDGEEGMTWPMFERAIGLR